MIEFPQLNLGNAPNDNTGDCLRVGGGKINANFVRLFKNVINLVESAPLSATNAWNYIAANSTDPIAITINPFHTTNYPFITSSASIIRRMGTGTVTLVAAQGVTIQGATTIEATGGTLFLRYLGNDIWDAFATGSAAGDGREVQLGANETHLLWKYDDEETWTDLIALADLKGDQGDPGMGVPAGGTTGQVATKKSATDYDIEWADPALVPGTEHTMAEWCIEDFTLMAGFPELLDVFFNTGFYMFTKTAFAVRCYSAGQEVLGLQVNPDTIRYFSIQAGENITVDLFIQFKKSALNRFEFTAGNAPTLANFETNLGITLVNGTKTGDIITFDNTGYTIGNGKYVASELKSVLSQCTAIGTNGFSGSASLESLYLPQVTSIATQTFFACTELVLLFAPLLETIGTNVTNNSVFANITGNTISVTVPTALATINSGNLEGDLAILDSNNTVTFTWV